MTRQADLARERSRSGGLECIDADSFGGNLRFAEPRSVPESDVARPTGVEPVTFGFGNQHSIQLSYGRIAADFTARGERRSSKDCSTSEPGIMRCFFPARRSGNRIPAAEVRPSCRVDPSPNREAMHEPQQHISPITNWKQLVVVVALAFIVPIAVIILLTQYVTDAPVQPNENDSAVLNRIKPVGEVVLATAGAGATQDVAGAKAAAPAAGAKAGAPRGPT